MRLFVCGFCSNVVYFENTRCEHCGRRLGYSPDNAGVLTVEAAGNTWLSPGEVDEFRFCANAEYDTCNWLIPAGEPDSLCRACRHNRTIPDLSVPENLARWRKLELARHHMFYGLLRLRLPLATRSRDKEHGLAFDVLADRPGGPPVLTGHADGVITLNLAEADDAEREKRRAELGEPYRALLGHFRHEIGHHYWDRLVRDGGRVEAFRARFGDERQDYGEALRNHYANGAPADWRERFVSAYAAAHPWEDFAETWAHYLHIVDTLEMAGAFGLRIDPLVTENPAMRAEVAFDPYAVSEIDALIRHWLPLAGAVNTINRCMGQAELYPFVLPPAVIDKLGFISDLARRTI